MQCHWADPEGVAAGPEHPLEIHKWIIMFPYKYWYEAPSRSNWTKVVQMLLEGGSYSPL